MKKILTSLSRLQGYRLPSSTVDMYSDAKRQCWKHGKENMNKVAVAGFRILTEKYAISTEATRQDILTPGNMELEKIRVSLITSRVMNTKAHKVVAPVKLDI